MGWWSEEKGRHEIIMGDGPLDIAHEMLLRIMQDYENDLERKPTLDELIRTIEIAVISAQDALFTGSEQKRITHITAKTEKRVAVWDFAEGDYLAVLLQVGGYAFLRIKAVFRNGDLLVELLDVYVQSILDTERLATAHMLQEYLTDSAAFEAGQWQIIKISTGGGDNVFEKDAVRDWDSHWNRLGRSCGSLILAQKLEEKLQESGCILG